MSDVKAFLKLNKAVKENVFFPATASLKGGDGAPLMWEIRHITTKDEERIREECSKEVFNKASNTYRLKLDVDRYNARLIAASVASPDLMNAELQDSYGVKTPEDLITEMVDNPGEYTRLLLFIREINDFGNINEQAEAAKN